MSTIAKSDISVFNAKVYLLCFSSLLFFSSFNLIIGELPLYLDSIGGTDYKGWIIALFTLSAAFFRPFSGKLSDTIGRVPVMILGALVCFLTGFFYLVATTVFTFLMIRFIHGFATGLKPTATTAYLADITPPNRRGEAIGFMGMFSNIGMALSPILGSYIAQTYSYSAMFMTSSILALFSILILYNLKESLENTQSFKPRLLVLNKSDVFEKSVLPVAFVIYCAIFSLGLVFTIIPDYLSHFNITNKGLFIAVMTLATFLTRFFAGKASDQYGRIPVLIFGLVISATAMFSLGFVPNVYSLFFCAFLNGVGVGMISPTAFAMAIDLCPPKARARGLSTVFIALELGIGTGALVSSLIYNNQMDNIKFAFMASSGFSLMAVVFLLWYGKKK